jgi:hypothetical protein
MTKPEEKQNKNVAKTDLPYEPTSTENAILAEYNARLKARPVAPRITIKPGKGVGVYNAEMNHPDQSIGRKLLGTTLGTNSSAFAETMVAQSIRVLASKPEDIPDGGINAALASIHGIAPQDELEAMLAVQMTATHTITMKMLEQLSLRSNSIELQNSASNQANKLMRTFILQMEALNRYRGKGQQKMTVEHVHVHEGGQAIVGNVQGGGDEAKK